MFIDFFYKIKDTGVPVSPTSFLRLQKALNAGLIGSLDDFYTASRAILVKSERYFDIFDQVFAHHFEGAELPGNLGYELDDIARALLDEWLKDPQILAKKDLKNNRGDMRAAADGSERVELRRWGIPGIIPAGCVWGGYPATNRL